ncbi:hypothetical protein H072_10344 [Dactylellina haptotyla CBS 200.50]|uniref:C3H1-type domain-containing protein n=1 Tax=Dactylellina haptotyla (strain CBS 200.50) TaxID=1284197 RepID=S8A4X7_DACHA|nr:hypothetical protein H072_10344 [Dactylellina haptotyla CBS 200.50]
MAHGCCFDYFEKGFCKAGNDCKYSHLRPGDERNLIMDSEQGLRRKKYYRPETLQTYLPGSQDVICFTFARKGWCIHGDKCWNQHISPPPELLDEMSPQSNGLVISDTPSPVLDDLPTLDTGYNLPQQQHMVLQQTQHPSPTAFVPQWSSTTMIPVQAGPQTQKVNTRIKEKVHPAQASQGKLFCRPDPKRSDASNWRVPTKPQLQLQTIKSQLQTNPQLQTSPVETASQTVRSVLNFNWRPVIDEPTIQDQEQRWARNTPSPPPVPTMIGCGPSLPMLKIPTGSMYPIGNVQTPIDYNINFDILGYNDEMRHHQTYRNYGREIAFGRSGIPYLH